MDADLLQASLSGVLEAMRGAGRNDDDVAGPDDGLLAVGFERGLPLQADERLLVRGAVQVRPLAWRVMADEAGDRRSHVGPLELVGPLGVARQVVELDHCRHRTSPFVSLRFTLPRMRITILGAGVSGLTCGVRLLEDGHRVTIVARDLPQQTTSAVAGAVWFPYRVAPNERTGPWSQASYERFASLVENDDAPVTMAEVTMLYPDPLAEEPWWLDAVPGSRVRASRPDELPDGYGDGRAVAVPCIQAPAYLDWLMRRFTRAGGLLEQR